MRHRWKGREWNRERKGVEGLALPLIFQRLKFQVGKHFGATVKAKLVSFLRSGTFETSLKPLTPTGGQRNPTGGHTLEGAKVGGRVKEDPCRPQRNQ